MIEVILALLLLCAVLVVAERNIVKMLIYLGVFSLLASLCFLFLASPDVAMAEAVVSTFSTIVFVVAFEKYYSLADISETAGRKMHISRHLGQIGFAALLLALFIYFIPEGPANTFLKDRYLDLFQHDVGGENAVTAIYLGYRMYDTLFEALMLFVSIVAVVYLSSHEDTYVSDGKQSDIAKSQIAGYTIRIISPVLVLFAVYLIFNGHISPGGGFQGGVLVASFFICRYMIYDIYDLRIRSVITLEKLIYIVILLFSAFFIFTGIYARFPELKSGYLIAMNTLIGLKVACGFLILFYRFIAFERR